MCRVTSGSVVQVVHHELHSQWQRAPCSLDELRLRWARSRGKRLCSGQRGSEKHWAKGEATGRYFVALWIRGIVTVLCLQRGSKVLRLSTAYQMVVETLDWLIGFAGIEVVVVPIEFPVKDTSQIVSAVRTAAAQNPDISFAVLSHITSMV